MLPARTRSRAVAAVFGLLAFGLLLTGCSTQTPLCNQAAALLGQGRPADAMALYARAGDQSEGNCASNGLTAAGKQIGQAAQEEAKGADAELNRDNAGAVAAYEEALKLNSGDARAAAGLVRLGQPVPIPAPVEIPPLPESTAAPAWNQAVWPLIVGGALLLVVALAAAGYALFRNDVLRRRVAGLQAATANPAAQLPVADPAAVDEVRRSADATAGRLGALDERLAALEAGLTRLAAGGTRRDRVVELLAGQLAGPRAGGVLREQLFEGPPAPAGSGVVDVELVAVTTTEGARRTVARRVRWTPPDDGAAAGLVAQLGADPVTVADVLATGTVSPSWARSTELWLLPEAAGPAADLGGDADPAADALATLVAGGALRDGALQPLTADAARRLAPDTRPAFLARLVTLAVDGDPTIASLTAEAHDVASGIAAAALETAAGLTEPVWAGATGRTPGPPAELDQLLGREPAEPDDRASAPVVVHVVADPLEEEQPLADGTTLRTTFRIERIAVDVEGVLGALNRSAADAARALAANPTDGPAIEAFRGALRPAPGAAPADRPEYPSTTAVPIGVSTIACDVVAVGDGREPRLDFGYRLGGAHLDLARMLKDSTELTIAFGAQLAGDARRPFDVALRDSVGPEQLGPIAAAVPGRAPALTAGPGSAGAVETHYAAAPEPPSPDDPDDDEDQPDMYAALRKGQPTGP